MFGYELFQRDFCVLFIKFNDKIKEMEIKDDIHRNKINLKIFLVNHQYFFR